MKNHLHSHHANASHHAHARHSHHHGARTKKQLAVVLVLSTVYMVAEAVGGVWSGSLALIADAGHMAVDTTAAGLGLFAIWMAQKPATPEKTYGYYRAEILAALVNGATLVAVSIWIMVEAFGRLNAPRVVEGRLMMAVAFGGLLINAAQLWVLHKRSHDDLNIRGVWLHLVTDTLGTAAALVAAGLVWGYGWYLADPIISFAIAGLILLGSWRLLSECVNVLLEGVPSGVDVAGIKRWIETHGEVKDVHDLHVWMVSTGVNALSAHVRLHDHADAASVLSTLIRELQAAHAVDHVTIQLEPSQFSTEQCRTLHCAQGELPA